MTKLSESQRGDHRDHVALGILFTVSATLVIALLDVTVKFLTVRYPVVELAFARFAMQFILGWSLLHRESPRRLLRSKKPALQLIRAACVLGTILFFMLALRYLPVADLTAVAFAYPLLVAVLARPILGEVVGAHRIVALVIGFCGICLILKPTGGLLQPEVIYPLLGAGCLALGQLATRRLRHEDPPGLTLIYPAFAGLLIVSPFAWTQWQAPSAQHAVLFLTMGALGTLVHYLTIKAHRWAPASTVASYQYVHIIFALILGYLAFHDLPDLLTIAGATIIVASGLWVYSRERS